MNTSHHVRKYLTLRTPTPTHDAHESSSRLRDTIARLEVEKVMLAKLASETPQFFNPWHCAEAIKLRDAVLANVQGVPAAAGGTE